MPAGDVFGLDGLYLNKANPITVSVVDVNPASLSAGIAITGGSFTSGTVTLNLSNAAGLTTTPFYTGAVIGVTSISQAGVALTGYNGTFVVTGFAGTTTVSYATTGYVGDVVASIGATTIGYIQLLTDGNVTNTTWSTAQTHGWFGGGSGPVSRVDRIDFSNDTGTANIRGPLSSARRALASTGNSNYGWFGGGSIATPAVVSAVDRIDFSNDSTAASSRGPLSSARYNLAATGNSNYGWFGGGFITGATVTVDRIDFSNDSATASVRGPLTLGRDYNASTGNSNYGWFGGGRIPGVALDSRVDRIDFSNDNSTASPRGPLSSARYGLAATGNSNYGWFGCGRISVGTPSSTLDRIDFSNDSSTSSARGLLNLARFTFSATGNSNYGWFGGGSPGPLSSVDRIDFSNDSVSASVRGVLSAARSYGAATSGQARSSSTRLQRGGNFGWFGGGSPGSLFTDIVNRINFSNDATTASVRGTLSSSRYALAATGNSNYGWFGGGYGSPAAPFARRSLIDRIDFSNDSTTASPRGPLILIRANLAATGNSNYGWFGGGITGSVATPSRLSTIDRIDFSNDAATASVRGGLLNAPAGRSNLAATGNSNYGWFGGGATPTVVATVDRIDFSNDSTLASSRGPLSVARSFLTATGNSNYGWFGGGIPITATVDRIDFSNDSTTASVRGSLSQARYSIAATGNSNYGWFGGGYTTTSRVDRIDFSNDLATASIRGSITPATGRNTMAATSNTPVG